MAKSRELLDELRDITSLRDTKLLEQSLLQTVYMNLPIENISILKTDAGKIWDKVTLSETGYDILHKEIELDADHAELINRVVASKSTVCDCICDGGYEYFYYHLASISKEDTVLEIVAKEGALELSAESMTRSIEVFNNYYSLLVYAQTDELTGLLNRNTFNQEIKRISLFASEPKVLKDDPNRTDSGESYWLGLIDIDNFKSVNDSYGHVFGDEVLILVAQSLKRLTRRFDTVYRFGGEEFLVLLRADNKENARAAFERFRQAIESQRFPQVGNVTISVGAIQITGDKSTVEILAKADKSLYYSKQHGRNQFHLYEDLVEQGILEDIDISDGDIELFKS
ncbi:GGDEF domain-containing protein [Curvivirga sp.]|uniref:GGDEF domain-containing protein n=1 Tax=Curvivirga sp. TaxID=2856848 RepID=UPI003B591072